MATSLHEGPTNQLDLLIRAGKPRRDGGGGGGGSAARRDRAANGQETGGAGGDGTRPSPGLRGAVPGGRGAAAATRKRAGRRPPASRHAARTGPESRRGPALPFPARVPF